MGAAEDTAQAVASLAIHLEAAPPCPHRAARARRAVRHGQLDRQVRGGKGREGADDRGGGGLSVQLTKSFEMHPDPDIQHLVVRMDATHDLHVVELSESAISVEGREDALAAFADRGRQFRIVSTDMP
jgi:hypothetical protein